MIKAVFFDVDGTLIHHGPSGSRVPPSTKASLAAMRRKGILLFVATGRIHNMLGPAKEIFPFDGYVALNGQYAFTGNGTVFHRLAHHPEDIRALIPLVKREKIPCLIIEEEACFTVEPSQEIEAHFSYMDLPLPQPYDISRLDKHPVLQFLAYIPMERSACIQALPHVEVTSAGGTILDCIPSSGGKEVGIAATAAHFGFSREEVLVFGDGLNDARMLRWAGVGVAMGNGDPATKEAADYVTTPVQEDGIKNALLHLGVLTPEDFLP